MWPWILGGALLAALVLSDEEKKRRYIAAHQRKHIKKRDGGVCRICGKPIYGFHRTHIDHKNPLANGGSHHTRNLQLVHAACNLKKGTRRHVAKGRRGRAAP
jgi:5-methylcytosine-specific restriction endonuclease McrA